MILYHGSSVVVKEPKIIKLEKGRDFGIAFYLTPIKEQAERMAKRRQAIEKGLGNEAKAIVSVFEWNENKKDIKYKKFEKADLDWLEMILKCRSDINFNHGYDVVEGKIADDNVGTTVSLCLNHFLTKEQTIDKLKFQKINSQIAFCNETVIKKDLKFIESYEVK